MFNISLDIDYVNIYRRNQNLSLLKDEDIIITKGLERACNVLSDFNFKATFFVIGDSVERYRAHYLRLLQGGHEIGNHTMSHFNLFELSQDDQEAQISKCQQIIKKELNYQAVGFKAPGYSVSERIYQMLLKYGIKYDTSCFNNILVPIAKILYYLWCGKNGFGTISQMFRTGNIHKKGKLFIIPVGTTIFRLPFYGSFHAMWPTLANLKPPDFPFTYLIHPIEFLENAEMGELKTAFRTTLGERVKIYCTIFKKLKRSQRKSLLLKNLIRELEHEDRQKGNSGNI